MGFTPLRAVRETAETRFALLLRPRTGATASLPSANRLLSHFLDHFSKAAGIALEIETQEWPGSWRFDHVLCEDLGQLVGRGTSAIHDARRDASGVAGRGAAVCCMDDAEVGLALSFEGRPSASWRIAAGIDIDGFVDAWYGEDGHIAGEARGTNLRQFLDGFAFGSGASVSVDVRRAGNLHHLYETVFRALGDAVSSALGGSAVRAPGDSSGLARGCRYTITDVTR